jgi:hypothetical protein
MSDVLNRMIERGTRALSPVEPLLAPWISPARDSGSDSPLPGFDLKPRRPLVRTKDPESSALAAQFVSGTPQAGSTATRDTPESGLGSAAPAPGSEVMKLELRAEAETVQRGHANVDGHTHAALPPHATLPPHADLPDRIPAIEAHSAERSFPEQQSPKALEVPAAVVAPTSRPNKRSAAHFLPDRRTERPQSDRDPVEVHVTIGHIEVRAVPAPTPAIRRPTPAHLSLTEYLARRNGDSR